MYAYLLKTYPPFKIAHPVSRPRKARATGPGLLGRGLRAVIRRWQRQRTIEELEQMDDRLLRDMGLYRGDIPRIFTDTDALALRRGWSNPRSRQSA